MWDQCYVLFLPTVCAGFRSFSDLDQNHRNTHSYKPSLHRILQTFKLHIRTRPDPWRHSITICDSVVLCGSDLNHRQMFSKSFWTFSDGFPSQQPSDSERFSTIWKPTCTERSHPSLKTVLTRLYICGGSYFCKQRNSPSHRISRTFGNLRNQNSAWCFVWTRRNSSNIPVVGERVSARVFPSPSQSSGLFTGLSELIKSRYDHIT